MSQVYTGFKDSKNRDTRKSSYISKATVAVLPEAEEVDIEIKDTDLKLMFLEPEVPEVSL